MRESDSSRMLHKMYTKRHLYSHVGIRIKKLKDPLILYRVKDTQWALMFCHKIVIIIVLMCYIYVELLIKYSIVSNVSRRSSFIRARECANLPIAILH